MSALLIRQEIEKIRKVVEAASPGPLNIERVGWDEGHFTYEMHTDEGLIVFSELDYDKNPMRAKFDAELFRASRTTLPQALDAIDALTKYLSENCYCYLSMAGLESTGGLIEPCSNCEALSTAASILRGRE